MRLTWESLFGIVLFLDADSIDAQSSSFKVVGSFGCCKAVAGGFGSNCYVACFYCPAFSLHPQSTAAVRFAEIPDLLTPL